MFICKNDKLYITKGDKIIGVNMTPSSLEEVDGSEIKLEQPYTILTPTEVRCKFNISLGYTFPVDAPVSVEPIAEVIASDVIEESVEQDAEEIVSDVIETPVIETPVIETPVIKKGVARKGGK